MKLNIHRKVLILVLFAGLTTFLVLGIVTYLGRVLTRDDMEEMSIEFGEKSTGYTEKLLTEQLKTTLGELAEARAQYIDREMSITREDAELIANAMSEILTHPENYFPKKLPDPRTDTVKVGEPYLIYAPDLRDKVTPEVQKQIALAANIKDFLFDLAKSYKDSNATLFVAGESGWHIVSRLVTDANGKTNFDSNLTFSHARVYEFDPRKRPWYIAAKSANKPVISDLYRTVEADGYQQIGASAPVYDTNGKIIGVAGVDVSNSDMYSWLTEGTEGISDNSFVLNDNGEIIFSSEKSGVLAVNNSQTDLVSRAGGNDLRKNSEPTLAAVAEKMVNNEDGIAPVIIDGKQCFISYAFMPETGWSFGMVVSESDLMSMSTETRNYFIEQTSKLQKQMLKEHSYFNNVIIIVPIVLLIILIFMSTNLSSRFVKPINELSDGVRDISSGNLDKKLDIHTGDEIEHLAVCFNAMTDELKAYMENLTKATAERERIATELNVATEIQNGMLPKDFPDRDDCELFATMTPAKEVGGDFYDFYFLDDKHLAITVADVSGKGISAALFMVISKTILNNFTETFYKQNGLAPVVAAANEQLCANNDAMMFVTAFVGVLDLDTGEFVYVNAGHNPPVVYHAEENTCDFLDVQKNFVMGPMDGIPFVEQRTTFKPGDLIFLYTDGVTEALNVKDEEYLPDRLIAFMNKTDCTVDLHELLKNVRADVADHVGEAEQSDDITMFALRFKGKAD